MKLNSSVKKPIISEKTMKGVAKNKFSFRIGLQVSKGGVAEELKRLFNVDAINVKTMVMPGKPKRVGKTNIMTKTMRWKKAVVTLKEGQSIDLFPKE